MSSYQTSWNSSNGESHRKATIPPEFAEEYPCLAEVFGGIEVPAGQQGGVPPSTVNLWFEGGELRFCLMPRIGNRIAFGVVTDPVKGLASLEAEVKQGRFGWKAGKNRRTA